MEQGIEDRAYAEARRVLRSLFLGIDPEDHSRLSPECVVMQPEVKTALALGAEALKDTEWVRRWREKRKTSTPVAGVKERTRISFASSTRAGGEVQHAGQAWNKQEDIRLTSAFYQGQPMRAIAAAHGRTEGAIAARLVRLGLVDSKREARSLNRNT